MTLAEKIKANYKDNAAPVKLESVPDEWETDIYIYPKTLGQMIEIESETDPIRKAIKTLVIRAKNDQGTRVFSDEDERTLISYGVEPYGSETLLDIYKEIVLTVDAKAATVDELAGN